MALLDVVKFDGPSNVIVWKYPKTDIKLGSQLIVNETQEAVLYKGGQIFDRFGPGSHTLEVSNVPILSKLVNLPFGNRTPFPAEVWFVSKKSILDIKWGTPTPVQLQDPHYNVVVPVRSFGQFSIQVADAEKFLISLVGTLPSFNTDELVKYFKGLYLTKIKDEISSYLIKKEISILKINAYISEISKTMKESVKQTFSEYGLDVIHFYVNDISVPEDDPVVIKLKDALSKKAEMEIIGYSYNQERSFDTLEGAATNSGSGGQFMGAGIGLGVGASIGNSMGQVMSELGKSITTETPTQKCPHCGSDVDIKSKFCSHCGKKTELATRACPQCGTAVQQGQKFCSNCGKQLEKKCKKCQASLEPGMKFCPECGAEME